MLNFVVLIFIHLSCSMLPFLTCSNISRGYMGSKLTNNIECEIFQVLLEEAKTSYPEDIVMALQSDCVDDISRNVTTMVEWTKNWIPSS